jgi:DNA-directed RNA polymerase subunit beta'
VGAQLTVHDGDVVKLGDTVAKISREVYKTRDITGGLPRVAELGDQVAADESTGARDQDQIVRFHDAPLLAAHR